MSQYLEIISLKRSLRLKWGFPDDSAVTNPPAMQENQETWIQSLCWEDPLGKEMVTHSSILAWKILWTEEHGRLQSIGLQTVGQLSNRAHMHPFLDQYSAHIGFHVFVEWMNSQPETILQILVAFICFPLYHSYLSIHILFYYMMNFLKLICVYSVSSVCHRTRHIR